MAVCKVVIDWDIWLPVTIQMFPIRPSHPVNKCIVCIHCCNKDELWNLSGTNFRITLSEDDHDATSQNYTEQHIQFKKRPIETKKGKKLVL